MDIFFHILSTICLVLGLIFFLGSSIGLLRFPDFYTRMHAAGKGDTLSTLLLLLSIVFYGIKDASLLSILVAVKVLAIGIFIMFTSPTSTHVLMNAGYEDGIRPAQKPTRKGAASDAEASSASDEGDATA